MNRDTSSRPLALRPVMLLVAALTSVALPAVGTPGFAAPAAALPAPLAAFASALLYKALSAPLERRSPDLFAHMSLAQKLVQITTIWDKRAELLDA